MSIQVKKGFVLRKIGAQYMAVPFGATATEVSGMISLTETGYFLWKAMEDGVNTVEGLVNALTAEYEVEREQAMKDICLFLANLAEMGVVSGEIKA